MVWKCWKSALTKSLLHWDGHILHLLLIFIMPESQPFAEIFSANLVYPIVLKIYGSVWGPWKPVDKVCVLVLVSLNYPSYFICQPATHMQNTVCMLTHIALYLPIKRTSHTSRRFSRIRDETFSQALFHSNCSYRTELYATVR